MGSVIRRNVSEGNGPNASSPQWRPKKGNHASDKPSREDFMNGWERVDRVSTLQEEGDAGIGKPFSVEVSHLITTPSPALMGGHLA